MKNLLKTSLLVTGIAASSAAFALTPAGTEITNQAIATYDVPGGASSVTSSSEAKFTVLELIDVNVTSNNGGNQTVNSGDADQVLTYTVTNNGNGSEVFTAAATNSATGDNFDVENIRIFVDTNNDGIYNTGDVEITSSPNITLAAEASTKIFVLNNIPSSGLVQGNQARVKVEVSSNTSGASSADAGTLLPSGEVVGHNPFSNKTDTFQVGTPSTPINVVINKTVIQIEDPFHSGSPSAPGQANQYVPGSKVTYQIVVNVNGSSGTVNNLVITDEIPNEMNFVTDAGTFTLSKDGAIAKSLTPASDADEGLFASGTATVTIGTATAGDVYTIKLQTEIK